MVASGYVAARFLPPWSSSPRAGYWAWRPGYDGVSVSSCGRANTGQQCLGACWQPRGASGQAKIVKNLSSTSTLKTRQTGQIVPSNIA